MAPDNGPAVEMLDPAASDDHELVAQLSSLINDVYAVAESGLWCDGATRTTPTEVAELIARGQIAVATAGDDIVGSVHIHQVAPDVLEFGMLVAAPDQRGTGVGRALLDFTEDQSRERELRAVQLELLVPRGWLHPTKEFLKGWYGRRGYRRIRIVKMEETHPQLAPLLATACDLEVHEKPL